MKNFIQELKRRNVIKSALAYLVVAWLITQVTDIIVPAFTWPAFLLRTLIIIIIVCFPFWIIFSWTYEITPEGIKRTISVKPTESITSQTGNRLNRIIIAVLVVAIGLLTYTVISRKQVLSESQLSNVERTTDTLDKSIAVLAFADMSPEKDQEYFSDGISEEILNLLTKVTDLKVISRTSSFSYKGKELDIKEIGKELQVGYVLEGSIRKSGNTFRITTQLIDANSGVQVWSEKYDRNLEDIFKIQDEIASKVTEHLKVSIMGLSPSKPVNTQAYTLFLKATQMYYQTSSESNTNALKLIKESIDIDSAYAPAWNLLSRIYYNLGFRFLTVPLKEAISKGKSAAHQAIALDKDYVDGYASLSMFESASWNFKAANELMNKALFLDPNNPMNIQIKSYFDLQMGKPSSTIVLQLKSKELDPLNDWNYFNLGFSYWIDGQYDKAEENLNQFLFLHPDGSFANSFMGQIQITRGNYKKALEYVDKDVDPFWSLYRKSMIEYGMENSTKADLLLKQLIADYGNTVWPNIADVYAYRNEKNEAFKWLELDFENQDASLLEILNYPSMQNLWGDPRWNKFIKKLGLPEDHGFHLDKELL